MACPADRQTDRVTVVLRPVRPAWMRPAGSTVFALVWGIGLAFAMAAFGNRYGDGFGWLGVAGVGVLLAVPAVLIVGGLVLRNRMRIDVDDGTLVHTDPRGRRVTVDSAAVRSVHDLMLTNRSEQRFATVVAGEGGAALLVLWHKTWDPGELGRLWSGLGWPVHQIEPMPVATAPTRFPGIQLPGSFVRPFRTAGLVVLCVFGYVFTWIAVMVGVTG